jgi:hypothetical protein
MRSMFSFLMFFLKKISYTVEYSGAVLMGKKFALPSGLFKIYSYSIDINEQYMTDQTISLPRRLSAS